MIEKDFLKMLSVFTIYINYCDSLFTKNQLKKIRSDVKNEFLINFLIYFFAPLFYTFKVKKSRDGAPFPVNIYNKGKKKKVYKKHDSKRFRKRNTSNSKNVQPEELKPRAKKRREFNRKRRKLQKESRKKTKMADDPEILPKVVHGLTSERNRKKRALKRLKNQRVRKVLENCRDDSYVPSLDIQEMLVEETPDLEGKLRHARKRNFNYRKKRTLTRLMAWLEDKDVKTSYVDVHRRLNGGLKYNRDAIERVLPYLETAVERRGLVNCVKLKLKGEELQNLPLLVDIGFFEKLNPIVLRKFNNK